MASGINDLMAKIDKLEEQIKKSNPKQKGRVIIANAKSNASYEVDAKDQFKWAVVYYEQLKKVM
jgi:hypothetical protein